MTCVTIVAALLGLQPVHAQALQTPQYEIDPFWPKLPFPDKWITGGLGGMCIDSRNHVFVLNRQNVVPEDLDGASLAPPVIEFDPDGNVVNSWGNPYLLGDRLHDCHVDNDLNVWIVASGTGVVQKYSSDGNTLLLQIGESGLYDSSDGTREGRALNSDRAQFFLPASIDIDAKTDRIFTWKELRPLVLQLCEALEYAHSEKIAHRDLKPANMMVNREGRLKLADFGIAASIDNTVPSTTPEGDSSGTMVYMSPQQMQGTMPHPTDDIYSLGATLYDLLTTRPPFYTGDIFQLAQEVPPPTLSQRLSDFEMENHVPPHVESAIMACLSKDRANRPAKANDLIALLHPGDQPPPPPPAPTEFIPELESVLAEPLEKTQKYLEKNLPEPVTSWWIKQNTAKRDIVCVCCVIIGLLATEIIYSKLVTGKFFETIKANGFFYPW